MAMAAWAISQLHGDMSEEQRERYMTIYELFSEGPGHRDPVPNLINHILEYCPYQISTPLYQRCVKEE